MNEIAKFPAMLMAYKGEIAKALPTHLSADRMTRIALTSFRQNPKLAQCDPVSVFAAVIQSAQLGLELDMQGHGFLVPYKRNYKEGNQWKSAIECQFIPGWKGLVDLCNRSGRSSISTRAAFVGDEFEYMFGTDEFVSHKPSGEHDPDKITHAYAIGKVRDSEHPVIEVWTIDRIWAHRDKYNKVGKSHYSFENQEMYARKVVLLQVLKYMPVSAELSKAMSLNDAAEVGSQNITIDDAIDGTWCRETVEESEPEKPSIQQPKKKKSAEVPPVTYNEVVEMINSSKSSDDLDLAMDLAGEFDEEQREKLIKLATGKSAKLAVK